MSSLNSVMLIGRLTKDPEVRAAPTDDPDQATCLLTLAVTERDRRGRPVELIVEVEARRRLGEICAGCLKQGSEVFAAGKLRFGAASGRTSPPAATFVVDARQIQFLSRR